MNEAVKKVENILKSEYSDKNYLAFVLEIFDSLKIVAPDKFNKEFSNFSSHIDGYNHLGDYITPEKKKVAVFSVCLKTASYVENSRSTQRSYAKKLIEAGNCDAALIAYYSESDVKWRISFVRLEFEMKFDNGKFKTTENLTPAKRYSFLVGKDEPCHTAISRFHKFIVDKNFNPSLDEIEEAFSVEKVTNEFFNLYCEKYHQLREKLEENENFRIEAKLRNFTSAQFAKKLLGQIVFLYFLQKKGWLGVNAWPDTLTEKEYKNAFFARGQKSRELIPIVYRPDGNGAYKVSSAGLKSISDEDEKVLAQCVKGKPWGSGPRDFMRKLFNLAVERNVNFFDSLLEPLFYDALNKNRGEQGYCPTLHCRIPFLSGGLFEPIEEYDWKHNDFSIPNEIFSNADTKGRDADGILDIFDRYNFTMSEDEPMEREVAIDPEMLGKVFENLLEINDRKSKGAFYTPREIVHYMCQETLINYLTHTLELEEEDIRDFILYGDFMKDEDTVKEKREGNGGMYISEKLFKIDSNGKIVVDRLKDMDKALQDVRVADPAVGSGAFPLGMLNEIVRARQNISAYMAINMNANSKRLMYTLDRSPHKLKYETIKNCIFAADIEPSAVDITQLRLWLALVIDDEINPNADSPLDGHRNPLPLPNLESNILCGNSLIDEFEGIKLVKESTIIASGEFQISMNQNEYDAVLNKLIDAQDRLFYCNDTDEKKRILKEISSYKDMIVSKELHDADSAVVEKYYESTRMSSKPYVLWQLDFARVFREKGGFDIVIGNPPYIDSETMVRIMPELRELYAKKYECAKGNWDLFVPFIEKGMDLRCDGGVISYIVPNKLMAAPYTKAIRQKMARENISEFRDYSNVNVFKTASVYPIVFRVDSTKNKRDVVMDVMADLNTVDKHTSIHPEEFYKDTDWDKFFNATPEALSIIEKMKKHPPLDSIANVNGAATVSEAYLIKDILFDGVFDDETKKFINTGGIDPFKSYYGIEFIRYLKGKYLTPVVKKSDLLKMSEKRYNESNSEKIIIGGMTKILECYWDSGEYLAGKSTTIVYNNSHLKALTGILNSKLMTYFYSVYFNSMSLAGGFFRIGAPQIRKLPIALPTDNVYKQLDFLVEKIQEAAKNNDLDTYNNLSNNLNTAIYSLYDLTPNEIAIVESSY